MRAGERETLMFSATFPEDIQRMARDFMQDYLFLARAAPPLHSS
jgi:superfamily II DNA/RNA helicase